MAKGITYTATDSKGTTHTRYSAGHKVASYTHCVVGRPGDANKYLVKFSGSLQLAQKAKASEFDKYWQVAGQEWANTKRQGSPMYPDAEILVLTAKEGK